MDPREIDPRPREPYAHTPEYSTGAGRNEESFFASAEALDAAADPVNSPAHYNGTGVETIDSIRAMLGAFGFKAFCRGNVLKYTARAERKGNATEDMAKAAWYARMAAGDDPREERK